MDQVELTGLILDVDYTNISGRSTIRVTLKTSEKSWALIDPTFHPHFYLVPGSGAFDEKLISSLTLFSETHEPIELIKVEKKRMLLRGRTVDVVAVYTNDAKDIPKLKDYIKEFGDCYEYDIPFWKRYLIDKMISPMVGVRVKAHRSERGLEIDEIKALETGTDINPSYMCFDIETYNVSNTSEPRKDPVLMISYSNGKTSGVLTTKKIDRPFVKVFKNEKEMIEGFAKLVKDDDIDILVGYNSSNFDLPYLAKRAKIIRANFEIARYGEEIRSMQHGLVETVKVPGRVNLDLYNVAKFVSVVGAAEQLLQTYNLKLDEVYRAITGNEKTMVDKKNIWQLWDNEGEGLAGLSEYSLSDVTSLNELYAFFIPLETETAKVSCTTLGEVAVSTVGQLAEFLLMRYAHNNNEIVPNRPDEREIRSRLMNTFEGAYVKTPDAGIYDNLAVLDFRGLYPSIIISYNIDPSTVCTDCKEYFEAPSGTKFAKKPQGIIPKVLELLIKERAEVKRAYKKNPDNKSLSARSNALKILANSFYGYLGYARSRWYSRECAGSVTALERSYILNTIEAAENAGFKVLYGDSISGDSLIRTKIGKSNCSFCRIEDTFKNADRTLANGKEYYAPKGLSVETLDATGKTVLKKVNYVMRHKINKKMYRVWLTNTQYLDATEDHSLIGFANLAKAPETGAIDRLEEVKPGELGKRVNSLIIKKKSVRNTMESRDYEEKMYALMGFFIGDGCFYSGHYKGKVTKRYYLGLACGNEEQEILEKLVEPLKGKGFIRHVLRKGRGDIVINGLDTVRLFEKEILQEGKKRIPLFMFNETEKNIFAFLRGLFSSDGTVMIRNKKPIIRYTTIDCGLAKQIQMLLWEVGIASSIFRENRENKYKGKELGTYSFHVNIKSKDVFIKNVGFISDRKNSRISTYKETSTVKRNINGLEFELSKIKKIEEIPCPEYVYDLDVSDTHRFFANGILVHNTDSLFLIMGTKSEEDVRAFLTQFNSTLPKAMELELEDFYTRGVFVGKRAGVGAGAKKKYALLSHTDRIKIRGFELVRRDWSHIARHTQRAVLETILKEGSKKKAVEIVRNVINDLKEGNVRIKDLVIYTRLRKGIESYDAKSPELSAVQKAIKLGVKTKEELEGATIGYVITKHGNTISEKAQLEDLAQDYDANYYISHQVVPATLKILKELGVKEEELKSGGEQHRLA